MRWGLPCGVAFVGAVACQGDGFFVCDDDVDCGGNGGVCQVTGACSFPDEDCDSGQRYGQSSSPSIAGECVSLVEGSGGSADSTTGSEADSSSGETAPVDPSAGACPDTWWDCAWSHRQRIGLMRPIAEPLTDVPLLVLLTAGRVDHDSMQNDGEDLRFVSASGAVAPHEIEHWDPQGVSTLWVNVDELGGSADHLWIYYGNPVAQNAQDLPAVWPEPHVGVWHLNGEPVDSTGHGNDAALAGISDTVPGHLANGRDIISGNARLDIEPSPSLADLMIGGGTISAWARARTWGTGGYGRIAHKSNQGQRGWMFFSGTGGQLSFGFDFAEDTYIWGTAEDVLARHRWAYVAVTYDPLGGVMPRFYIDGVEHEAFPGVNQPELPEPSGGAEIPSDAEVPLILGNRSDNQRRYDGILDEVRIESTIRSPEWIAVQYDATRDELLRYGDIESQGVAP